MLFRSLARNALLHPEAVQSVLTELEPMGEVGPVNIDDVVGVLGERLRFLRSEPAGKRWGRVFVGSMEEARGRAFDAVFVPGMAEGLFPQKTLEDPLLLDQEKAQLPPGSLRELRLRKDQAAEERMRLRLAIAAAGESFTASYPRMDAADARPRVPSFYALEIARATRGALPEL